ncbi:hypothetical protein PIB30_056329 [Stylosanthes scabra]|uniref:Uncharacterized protein n=1 Tax=Stylosanthes scabra TaxID=79078 RepID=A0ABU6UI38_9FABA|nr:hypothetical protein [Stylosanthes scabra]
MDAYSVHQGLQDSFLIEYSSLYLYLSDLNQFLGGKLTITNHFDFPRVEFEPPTLKWRPKHKAKWVHDMCSCLINSVSTLTRSGAVLRVSCNECGGFEEKSLFPYSFNVRSLIIQYNSTTIVDLSVITVKNINPNAEEEETFIVLDALQMFEGVACTLDLVLRLVMSFIKNTTNIILR